MAQGSVRAHLESRFGVTAGGGPVALQRLTQPGESDLLFAPGHTTIDLTRNTFAVFQTTSIALGDLHLSGAALPAAGLDLRDLTLVMEQQARADVMRATPDLLSLGGHATLALHWNLVLEDGSLYALGPIDVGPFELRAAAQRGEDDATTLELALLCPGSCGGVPELFELSDAAVDLTIPVTIEAR